jgi:hypothetical protein
MQIRLSFHLLGVMYRRVVPFIISLEQAHVRESDKYKDV